MNKKDVEKAEGLLDPYASSTKVCAVDASLGTGNCLSVQWLDGGQKVFYSLTEVEEWLRDRDKE